jgi:hypothetical protein
MIIDHYQFITTYLDGLSTFCLCLESRAALAAMIDN